MRLHPPALLRVLVALIVEVQGDLRIQANAKVVVHDTLLCVALPAEASTKSITTTWHGWLV